MDFTFTEEQELMRESVKKFAAKDYDFETRRKIVDTDAGFSRDMLTKFAELGWTSVPFSEEDGGFGGSAVDTMIVLEELAKGLVVEPYLSCIVFPGALLKRGNKALRAAHLPQLIETTKLYAVAYAEQDARFDVYHQQTRAEKDGDGFRLYGDKVAVFGGASADYLIVAARTSGAVGDARGITLFVVPSEDKGVQRLDHRTVDGLRMADVRFEGVSVPADAVVGEIDGGGPVLERAVDEATIALGAEAMGVMEVLYKTTVTYTKERVQFGHPISKFQTLQFRMADMYVAYEEAKSMVYMASMSVDSDQDVAKAASAMKVCVGKAGTRVGEEAIQLHGGMGMTEELAVSHFFKRMTMIGLQFGDVSHHLKRYQACCQD